MYEPEKRPFVAGNWKMHMTGAEALELVRSILEKRAEAGPVRLAVFPPFTALTEVSRFLAGSGIEVGGQDLFWENSGAFTGGISGPMLKDAGCRLVLVGHSERRKIFGESDDIVARKLRAAIASGLEPILCLGENLDQRETGKTAEIVEDQFRKAVTGLPGEDFGRLVIAYEPVWAIGTGKTALPAQAQEVHALIRRLMAGMYGNEIASRAIILYGGSVKPDNSFALYREKDIDGFLVGGASLKSDDFLGIAREALRTSRE